MTATYYDVKQVYGRNYGSMQLFKRPYCNQLLYTEGVMDFQKGDNEYLFRSRVGANKPITRVMAYMIINEACKKAGINDSVGTHSLRKTFSYHHYQQFHDIVILQSLLNHSSEAQCLRYIGITQDNVEKTLQQFEL